MPTRIDCAPRAAWRARWCRPAICRLRAAQAERAVVDARAKLGGFPSSLFLGEALLVLGEVAAAQNDPVAARRALDAAARPLGEAVGDKAPLRIAATRALAALGG